MLLPFADVRPGGHHVVVDLGDLVRVVVGVQCQQFVSKCVGFIHLTLPLLQLRQKELKGGGDNEVDHDVHKHKHTHTSVTHTI